MNNTLRTLNTLITHEFEGLSLEELAVVYRQKDLNPSVLATAFYKTYNLIITVSQNYYGLTSEDIASFSLETLDKCLQIYTPNKSAFSTFFTTVLKNRFRQETESLSTDKRRIVYFSDSYEAIVEEAGAEVFGQVEEDSEKRAIAFLQEMNLDDREFRYCYLLMQGYKNSEIADMLQVSIMTLSNMRKKLRVKLNPQSLYFA